MSEANNGQGDRACEEGVNNSCQAWGVPDTLKAGRVTMRNAVKASGDASFKVAQIFFIFED